jgi:hypothetical protein
VKFLVTLTPYASRILKITLEKFSSVTLIDPFLSSFHENDSTDLDEIFWGS